MKTRKKCVCISWTATGGRANGASFANLHKKLEIFLLFSANLRHCLC